MEAADDGLPEIECAAGFIGALPALSPPIIEGVLRQGHKLLLAGPPKSGKTFALIELAIAIAEGRRWMGFQCGQGRVLYANLEVDGASAKHRIAGVYAALGWEPRNAAGIDLWSLRGSSLPIDRLAPKLIRRARKRQYAAVIFDPIYKIITGDENSADQMAAFCNQFDRICAQLGAAAIYCHHHSKGAQAHKRSMDRASGSGVFARDPDALLDYIELEPPEGALEAFQPGAMSLPQGQRPSALRIEGTLREFAAFDPVDCWFRHPIHVLDAARLLKGAEAGEEAEPWRRAARARRGSAGDARAEKRERLEQALAGCNFGARATVEMLADYLDRQPRTVYDTLRKMGYFVKSGKIYKEGEAPDGE
jgi:hypothetical protein